MKTEFCDKCGSFELTSRIDSKNICVNCRQNDVVLSSRIIEKIETETHIKYNSHSERLKEFDSQTLEQYNNILTKLEIFERKKTYIEIVRNHFLNDEGVWSIPRLQETLKIPRGNIEQSVFQLRKENLIFRRAIHDKSMNKKYTIYSSSEKNIVSWQQCELQIELHKILRTATVPLKTKVLSEMLGVRGSSILKCVRKHFKDILIKFKVESENYYVLKSNTAIAKNIFFFYPTAKIIKTL
jgi:hypothetical protein